MCLDNEIAKALKMNAIRMDAARLGHGEQQQVELFERVGQPQQEPAGFPARLWRDTVSRCGC